MSRGDSPEAGYQLYVGKRQRERARLPNAHRFPDFQRNPRPPLRDGRKTPTELQTPATRLAMRNPRVCRERPRGSENAPTRSPANSKSVRVEARRQLND